MIVFMYLFLFFVGLVVGSYLNSWVWSRFCLGKIEDSRFFAKKIGTRGRSICVHCFKELKWYDNIPVFSYLNLKGKCRFCNGPIPKEYIWVELAGGFLLVLIGAHAQLDGLTEMEIFRNLFFGILLLVIFVYDAKYMEIPSGVVWAGVVVALSLNFFSDTIYVRHVDLVAAFSNGGTRLASLTMLGSLLIGMSVGGGFFLAQYLVSKGRWIGGGDVRLGVLMGALLGWPQVAVAIGISYVLGAIYALPILLLKKKTAQAQIAFGTFLAVGTIIAMLWGNSLLSWYLGMSRW